MFIFDPVMYYTGIAIILVFVAQGVFHLFGNTEKKLKDVDHLKWEIEKEKEKKGLK